MKDRFFNILHFSIKTLEVLVALLLLFQPLWLYLLLSANADSGWLTATSYQKLMLLGVVGGLPAFCGLVWLKLIWRRRKQLADYDPPGKEDK